MPVKQSYHTILVLDIERSSQAGDDQVLVRRRRGLRSVLEQALANGEIDTQSWIAYSTGDGLLVEFIPSVPTAKIVRLVLDHAAAELDEHNRHAAEDTRIRVRAVVHAAHVLHDEQGIVSREVTLAFRDSSPPEPEQPATTQPMPPGTTGPEPPRTTEPRPPATTGCGPLLTHHMTNSSIEVRICPDWAPDSRIPVHEDPSPDSPVVGHIRPSGDDWYSCQLTGELYELDEYGYQSKWWAFTLADNDQEGYASQVYFRGGENGERDAKLKRC